MCISYTTIREKFSELFPQFATTHWSPAGRQAIKVRLVDGGGLIFTYTDDSTWSLERMTSYHIRKG